MLKVVTYIYIYWLALYDVLCLMSAFIPELKLDLYTDNLLPFTNILRHKKFTPLLLEPAFIIVFIVFFYSSRVYCHVHKDFFLFCIFPTFWGSRQDFCCYNLSPIV